MKVVSFQGWSFTVFFAFVFKKVKKLAIELLFLLWTSKLTSSLQILLSCDTARMTNVHFTCNLGLSISGFILSYNENGYDLPPILYVRVGYDNHRSLTKLRLFPNGLAEFTDVLLPEAGPKAFLEQAYTLEVLDDDYTVLYRKDFHYTSMALSSEWWINVCTLSRAHCIAKTELCSGRSLQLGRELQATRSIVVYPGHDPCQLPGGQDKARIIKVKAKCIFPQASCQTAKSAFLHGWTETCPFVSFSSGRWNGTCPWHAGTRREAWSFLTCTCQETARFCCIRTVLFSTS